MTQFTVICTHENTVGRSAIQNQKIEDYLNTGFLKPDLKDSRISADEINGFDEEFSFFCPIEFFKETKTYKEFWKQ